MVDIAEGAREPIDRVRRIASETWFLHDPSEPRSFDSYDRNS